MPKECKEVEKPAYHPDARVMARRLGIAFLEANGTIKVCREWHDYIRARYAKG